MCIGLLQRDAVDCILESNDLCKANEYDTKVFTCSISMPPAILIREHGMRLHLEDKYPEFFNDGKFIKKAGGIV